jgi:PPOX class probable F420-dependent enzyme
MELSEAMTLAASNHRAVLATRRRDGAPQMSPVVQAVGEDGRILISTRSHLAKAHNVRRDPAVSVCLLPDALFGRWVQVDGTAAIVELPDAMPLLRFVYRTIQGEHPDWDDFERAMVNDGRVIVAITPERAAG